ncbi:kinase [Rossellomorea sp. SC111]|nr:kinase [Rossellomorea sp. SC111]
MLEIISELISLVKSQNRYILGIDGLSRSGKTTLVKQLQETLDNEEIEYYFFHIDDHIVEREGRYNTGFEEWYEYFQLQWDVDWLKRNFFEKLIDCDQINLPYYHSDTDTQEIRTVTLPKTGLIVIEGVFLQRKEWQGFFDKVLFLDCSQERRFMRETKTTKRNREKFERRYWKAEEYYINTFKPLDSADIVIKT